MRKQTTPTLILLGLLLISLTGFTHQNPKPAIVHLVLFKLKEGIKPDDPRVSAGFEMARALKTKIPQIRDWEFGMNITPRPIAYDFGLYSTFDSEEDLAAYVNHPDHKAIVEHWKPLADWALVDFKR